MLGQGDSDFEKELLGRYAPCPPLLIYFHHHYVESVGAMVIMARIVRMDGSEILGMCTEDEAKAASLIHPQAVQWLTRVRPGRPFRRGRKPEDYDEFALN